MRPAGGKGDREAGTFQPATRVQAFPKEKPAGGSASGGRFQTPRGGGEREAERHAIAIHHYESGAAAGLCGWRDGGIGGAQERRVAARLSQSDSGNGGAFRRERVA